MNITYYAVSDIGGRKVNEDTVGTYESKERAGFVLCDGLGGHGMGDVASKLVKDVFINQFESVEDIEDVLPTAFYAGQDILMAEQKRLNATQKMKTTAVALVIDDKKAYVGHVGDSRLYIFRNNKVLKRTLDHSIPQMLVMSKEIKESEIRNHPDRSMLLKVMGIEWDEPMFELMRPISLKKCQAFLLCSDGFWELIDEERMCALLEKSRSPEEWLKRMGDEVKANGLGINMDNNSAIAVWNS